MYLGEVGGATEVNQIWFPTHCQHTLDNSKDGVSTSYHRSMTLCALLCFPVCMIVSQFTEAQRDDVTHSRSQSYHATKWDFSSEAALSRAPECHKMMEEVDACRNDTKAKLTLISM